LLARLKTYASTGINGGTGAAGGGGGGAPVLRKSEYFVESQAKRYAAEVYPAVADLVAKYKLAHVLDICCGIGALLVHVARTHKRVVGVGVGADGIAVRRANAAITNADLEKRLIAITASPFDVCIDTQHTFDRIGVSRQLWKEITGIVATNLFSENAARPEDIARTLAALPRNFPTATLLLIEPVASPRFDRNYYAPELTLLLSLARATPWPPEKWREALAKARYRLLQELPLTTDGLTIFVCKP
jgi:SAM-dependent methyltransferase